MFGGGPGKCILREAPLLTTFGASAGCRAVSMGILAIEAVFSELDFETGIF